MKFNFKIYIGYFIFFLALTSYSRLLQNLYIFNSEHKGRNVSFVGSRYFVDKSCKPKEDSILSIINNSKRKTLLIVIDAYPVNSIYYDLTSNDSQLHKYLKSNSLIYGSNYSKYERTAKSLAYLLAGYSYYPGSGCTYPYFGNNSYLEFINSGQFFSQESTLCDSRFKSIKDLVKIAPFKIASEIPFLSNNLKNKYIEIHDRAVKHCSLVNPKVVQEIPPWIKNKINQVNSNLLIFHDFYFHQHYNDFSIYPEIDRQLTNSLRSLVGQLILKKDIDDLLIMSDHGPRVFSNPMKKSIKNQNLSSDKKSKNEYGYFISYFPIKSINEEILEPISKLAKYRF